MFLSQATSSQSHATTIESMILYSKDEIIERIKQCISSESQISNDLTRLYKSLIKCDEVSNVMIELVTFLWSLEQEGIEQTIYMLINTCTNMSVSSSQAIVDHIKSLISTEKLMQPKLLKMFTVLLVNICHSNSKFSVYMNVSRNNCKIENVALVVEAIRETNRLTAQESTFLIKHLVDYLSVIELEFVPNLVREILKLCDKNNFQYCIGAVVNFFNEASVSTSQLSQSTMSSDSKRMINIQKCVINCCFEIGKSSADFLKEVIKFCKANNPVFSISGFMCIILLKLAALDYVRDQILEMLKTSIMSCLNDNRLFIESAFARESNVEHYDLNALLLHAVKFCSVTDREHISSSLIELGFLLIKSGMPKHKVVQLKNSQNISGSMSSGCTANSTLISEGSHCDFSMNILQKQGQAGIEIIIQLFSKLSFHRQLIINDILKFILKESHKPAVFVYLELLADLISLLPTEIVDCLDSLSTQPIFELFCMFPPDVSTALLHSLLPVIRYSTSLRDSFIRIIVTNIVSGREQARQICVDSALILLKYFRVTEVDDGTGENESLLTQCSQFACTQIAADAKPVSVDNTLNEEICTQILSLLDEACNQYPDTKVTIYLGLVKVIERNKLFARKVIDFLIDKYLGVINKDDENNLFSWGKIVDQSTKQVVEPISVLTSCIVECFYNFPDYDTDDLSNLIDAVIKSTPEALGFNITTGNDRNNIISDLICDLYDVLITYTIGQIAPDKDVLEKLYDHKSQMTKQYKAEKQQKKDDTNVIATLPTLSRCLTYLLPKLIEAIKEKDIMAPPPLPRKRNTTGAMTRTNLLELSLDNVEESIVTDPQDSSSFIILIERVSLYVLTKCLGMIRKIGSSYLRITHRNRHDYCILIAEILGSVFEYYMSCLNANEQNVLLNPSTQQRQIMHTCLLIYCTALNKSMQYFYKNINDFLGNLPNLDVAFQKLQDNGNSNQLTQFNNNLISSFSKLNKAMLCRLILLRNRKYYSDIEPLIYSSLNVAIYCGIDNSGLCGSTIPNRKINWQFGPPEINTTYLNNLYLWLNYLLKNSKLPRSNIPNSTSTQINATTNTTVPIIDINDAGVCKSIVNVYWTCARYVSPDWLAYLDRLVVDVCSKIGYYEADVQEEKHVFEFINNASDIIPDLLHSFSIALDETEWIMNKWKSRWAEIKQRKDIISKLSIKHLISAISSSQLSNVSSTPSEHIEIAMSVVTEQERNLNTQLHYVCSIVMKLLRCNINNIPRLQDIVKLTTKLFSQLLVMTKQYLFLNKMKLGSFSSVFEKLVKTSLIISTRVSVFIVHLQKTQFEVVQKEKKKDKAAGSKAKLMKSAASIQSQVGKTTKEMRLVPNLVYSIEQYNITLIELERVTKVKLMSNWKTMGSRDFHIVGKRVQENLEIHAQNDNDSADMDVSGLSDIEGSITQNSTENASDDIRDQALSPPKKVMRV